MHRHEENLTSTIEFRQHTGTLDYLTIAAWVMLTCNIVEYCNAVRDFDFISLCIRAGDPDFRLGDLFATLDTPNNVIEHYLDGEIVGLLPVSSDATEDDDLNFVTDSFLDASGAPKTTIRTMAQTMKAKMPFQLN